MSRVWFVLIAYWLNRMFLHVFVILFIGGKGVLSHHALQVVSQHALLQEGVPALGGGLLLGGVPTPRGVCRDPLKADGYCCGRYASYWNAFLFLGMFVILSTMFILTDTLQHKRLLLSLFLFITDHNVKSQITNFLDR